ncbi:hypothetical protein LOTGIDRAFT_175485 [Lottia gigantea]|uniref:Uncharacterized protein n=1 Tax=Lottia gigantea TaxID=225164 RepID=V3ZSG1_LOTGI|nr:hypothetical protein LOTGIDRAFT_175485 [Lottia gigantea]ESO94358.1 hypothetical protein LOTGIDRAFT_175485 [Lottia gigantea]
MLLLNPALLPLKLTVQTDIRDHEDPIEDSVRDSDWEPTSSAENDLNDTQRQYDNADGGDDLHQRPKQSPKVDKDGNDNRSDKRKGLHWEKSDLTITLTLLTVINQPLTGMS